MGASLPRAPVGGVVLDKEEYPLTMKNESWLIRVGRVLSTKVKALQSLNDSGSSGAHSKQSAPSIIAS